MPCGTRQTIPFESFAKPRFHGVLFLDAALGTPRGLVRFLVFLIEVARFHDARLHLTPFRTLEAHRVAKAPVHAESSPENR